MLQVGGSFLLTAVDSEQLRSMLRLEALGPLKEFAHTLVVPHPLREPDLLLVWGRPQPMNSDKSLAERTDERYACVIALLHTLTLRLKYSRTLLHEVFARLPGGG